METNNQPPKSQRLIYFGHNRDDVALIRRITSFMDAGVKVTAFTFRRDGAKKESPTKWENIDLGYVEHAKPGARLLVMLKTLGYIIQNRQIIKQADIIYARNLDIFILAWFAKLLTPFSSAIMVYECLDVHESLTKKTVSARVLRWVERRILKRCDLLVVSSPGFMKRYFEPVQTYKGRSFLVENKLHIDSSTIKRPDVHTNPKSDNKPIKLVWAGILRCHKTLDLMKALANTLRDDIDIHFWGKISHFLIPDFEDQIKNISNITFHGSYSWPEGLEKVYRDADLVWSQELSWGGYNSDWLIPNRIYEASYFNTLSLAVAGTQTAECVNLNELGYVLPDAKIKTLIHLITNLNKLDINKKKRALNNKPAADFIITEDDTYALLDATLACKKPRPTRNTS